MYSDYGFNKITSHLNAMQIRPLDVMVTGVTGSGKSSTLNMLFEKTIAKVGTGVDPETMDLNAYRLSDIMRFWDTPGLGDGVYNDRIHGKKLIDLMYKTYTIDNAEYGFIDIILVIIEGSNRDMGTTYKLLNDIIVPNFQGDRILVAINQADVAMKSRHWDSESNMPDSVLLDFLEEQAFSIQKRVKEATGISIIKPVYYSALYGYNVESFLDLIINNIPKQKRSLV
ncbi:hypothetical protein FACS1894167_11980 [Synergistales bacterium]|nr:hypothetical protein FACS1894167_11980 [Synergistales bacterium]